MTIYQKLESLQTFWFDREHDAWWDLGPFEDKQAGLVQSMGAKGKNCWEAVEIGTWSSRIYPYSRIPVWKIWHWLLVPATLSDGNPPNVQKIWPDRTETLRLSHWGNCKFCDWDGRKLLHQLTLDCGKVRGRSCQNLCCWLFQLDRRGSFSCLSDTAFAYSNTLSPATCHPVQCRPNMRVADCSSVWVCKCLQLMHLTALHLTLFDICSTIYVINCFNQTSLSWGYDYLPEAWNFVNSMICKRASQVMGFGFGSFRGQTGWSYSKHDGHRQNCWEAVEIGIG